MKKIQRVVFFICICATNASHALLEIEINEGVESAKPIAILAVQSDLQEQAALLESVVYSNLYRSGMFSLLDKKQHPQIEVTGSTLKKIKKITKTPIVAIGGINSENYKNLLLNNANFLAISGYVWNNKKYKPLEAIERLK